jgi:lysophospholipase L1-like esterase
VSGDRRGNLVAIAAGTLFALLVVEALLRVLPLRDPTMLTAFQSPPWQAWADPAWGNPSPAAYRAAPKTAYEHAPSVREHVPLAARADGGFEFRTNELGLRRDIATAIPKPHALRRVLVLGDSQTDGYVANPESFSALLEASLRGALATDAVEVLNAGVSGYSPVQEKAWYETHGAELAPDVVVLVLYAGNDVVDLADPTRPSIDAATGRIVAPVEDKPSTSAGPGNFAGHDRLDSIRIVRWSRAAVRYGPLAPLWQRFELPGRLRQVGDFQIDTLVEVLRTCHGCFYQSLKQAAYARRHPDTARRDIGQVVVLATRLDAEVRAHGGELVVAVLPTRPQVELERARDERDPTARLLELKPSDLAFEDTVLAELSSGLQAASLRFVRLLEPLQRAAVDAPQYYERDWHLGPLGHRTVAAALAPSLINTLKPAPDQASR